MAGLRYREILHVSPTAVVFRATQGRKPVAVKLTSNTDEPAKHRQALAALQKVRLQLPPSQRDCMVPLLSSRVGALTLPKIFVNAGDVPPLQLPARSALLVMPLYRGSAADLIKKKDFDGGDYEDVILTAEAAFHSLEDSGWCHGKPQPSNVLYKKVGRSSRRKWAVTDFGHLHRGHCAQKEIDSLEQQLP
jgi:hypothetical protein